MDSKNQSSASLNKSPHPTPQDAQRGIGAIEDYFDRVLVITLERAADRRQRIHENLRGLSFEAFSAVDGRLLDIDKLIAEGAYDPRLAAAARWNRLPLTPGGIGCALSHLKLLQMVSASSWRRVLVLEDDAWVSLDGLVLVPEVLEQLPDEWDLLYLGYLDKEPLRLRDKLKIGLVMPLLNMLGLKSYDMAFIRNHWPRPFSQDLLRAGFHNGTHAYAVTREGARKILSMHSLVSLTIDTEFGNLCAHKQLAAYAVRLVAFVQDQGLPPTIESDRHRPSRKNFL